MPTHRDLPDNLRQPHEQGGATVELRVVRPQEAFALAELANHGDESARLVLNLSLDLVRQIGRMPPHRPARCGACRRTIRRMKFSCVVAVSHAGDVGRGMGTAICQRCGAEPADIKAAAIGVFRSVRPDIRPVIVTHPAGGHA